MNKRIRKKLSKRFGCFHYNNPNMWERKVFMETFERMVNEFIKDKGYKPVYHIPMPWYEKCYYELHKEDNDAK